MELSPLLTERLDAQRVTQLVRASADVTLKLKRTLMVNVSGGNVGVSKQGNRSETQRRQLPVIRSMTGALMLPRECEFMPMFAGACVSLSLFFLSVLCGFKEKLQEMS